MSEGLRLTAWLRPYATDAQRGVVRVHSTVLVALGAIPWSALALTGARTTGALAAHAPDDADPRVVYVDELTLGNLGVASGSAITVSRAGEHAAVAVTLSGPPAVVATVAPEVVRLSLLGKVVTEGDVVSLLPQDTALPEGVSRAALDAARLELAQTLGGQWTAQRLTVVSGPSAPSLVTMGTALTWEDGAATAGSAVPLPAAVGLPISPLFGRSVGVRPSDLGQPIPLPPSAIQTPPPPVTGSAEILPGLEHQAASLREWCELGFHQRGLLTRLGTRPSMGVLLSGPAGSGKQGLIDAVAQSVGARVVRLWAPALAAADATSAAARIRQAVEDAEAHAPAVLVVEDVEAIAPRESTEARGRQPLGPLWREELRQLVERGAVAVVCTTTRPEEVAQELRHPGLLEHELVVPLPDRAARRLLIAHLTKTVPLAADVDLDEVAARTPGFVYADLLSLVRQAGRVAAGEGAQQVGRAQITAALDEVRPTSMADSQLDIAALTLDDVGDMAEVKQALTEAVLWPLRFPDTFTRMGVSPPRGVLMYGPPGCGKTFLVKALAGSGEVNVLSVKGAELMSKWVGESEAGVRELFRRAREAAPSLIFLDEVDALAPVRGQGQDSGVTDRVVASLLTELDGVEELRQVVVVAATNRPDLVDPALTRPGRLERLVYVAPPDTAAREAVLRAAARAVPLADGVDLSAVAADCVGFSSADLAALVREAAMTAMRRSMESSQVSAEDVAAARAVVKPSLDAGQVAALAAYAGRRAGT